MNSTTHLTEIKFSDTKLNTQITAELEKLGFVYCTPIQAATLPFAVIGKDIAGQAQTGTGKTIAFLAAALHHLISNPLQTPKVLNQPRALIIAPTRELVVQIYHDAQKIASKLNLHVANAYGGDGYDKQLKELTNGVDILVATTGRLIDYIKQNYIDLSALEVLVLDEADRMFDLGFIKDLRWLFRRMPPYSERLTMLFSATLSLQVKELAFEHMNEPEYVEIEPTQRTNKKIKEELFYTANSEKMALLQTIIEEEWPEKGIIFANTKHTCELICGYLAADQHRVGLLTSDVPQKKRLRILDSFAKGDLDLLVATDVVSRGIHIPSVTHVFNYDLPDNCDDYVHRIGRTGRAGESGYSISFACEKYATNLPAIEASIEHPIPVSHYNPDALLTDLPKPHIPRSNYSRRPGSMKTQRNRPPKAKRT